MFDMAVLAGEIAAMVSDEVDAAVARALAPVLADNADLRAKFAELETRDPAPTVAHVVTTILDERIATLPHAAGVEEVRQLVAEAVAALPPAKDGKSVDPEAVQAMVSEAVAALPVPQDGKSVDMAEVEQMVATAVAALPPAKDGESIDPDAVRVIVSEAVAALPVPQDGKSVDMAEVERMVAAAVAAIPPAKDGESVDLVVVRSMIDDQVAVSVAALPPPVQGKDADMGAAFARIDAEVQRAVAALPVAKDGAGIADLLIDRDGALVASFTDGRMKNLGTVVGKDGDPGVTFTLDDFDIVQYDDGRTLKLGFTRGEVMHSFEVGFPVILDRGVYTSERAYEQGDAVTWGGSLWIAQRATSAKPDTADSGWRLAVKKGRNGKDKA